MFSSFLDFPFWRWSVPSKVFFSTMPMKRMNYLVNYSISDGEYIGVDGSHYAGYDIIINETPLLGESFLYLSFLIFRQRIVFPNNLFLYIKIILDDKYTIKLIGNILIYPQGLSQALWHVPLFIIIGDACVV
jgi:hypothetical protein